MKIIFVTDTLQAGGAERVISILANKIQERGHEVEIICLRMHKVFYEFNPSVKLTFAEDYVNGGIIKKIFWLRKYVSQQKPSVVIAFMIAVYATTLLSMIGNNIPVIVSERIDPRRTTKLKNVLRCVVMPLIQHMVVQTEDIKSFFPSFIQKKTSIIYNPVMEVVFKQTTNVLKEKRLINIGRLYEQKNQRMLIEAFSIVKKEFPEYELVIFGEGPLKEDLQNYINEKGLNDSVTLMGKTTTITDELQASEIFCLSSDYEGMSNAMIEAVCLGIPVVTTDISGAKDIITNGENGYVVNVNDALEFANAISKILSNEDMKKQMGKNNLAKAEIFRTDTIVDSWIEIINKMVKYNKV